ncbi:MAG TPA: MCE family protein [Nocardioides sp.]|nr:MCE family protein [Nocardioides sp.]
MSKQMSKQLIARAAGVGLILAVIGAFALTAAFYNRAFDNPAQVTLTTARAGLVMDAGNKVKLRGVEIGRVGSVRLKDGKAVIVLDLDRDQLDQVPANVTAQIRATTVFGAKYVELVPPADPSTARLADGSSVRATGVTVEVNTVFDDLDRVLGGLDVAGLNNTLTVVARTLSGRGAQMAQVAARADDYLTRLQPELPQLRRDLLGVARLARLGVQISPALLAILRNATVTANTVNSQSNNLSTLLLDLSILGDHGARVLGVNADALATLLRTLRPTAATLHAYSTELPCLFQGLDNTRKLIGAVIGGTSHALRALVSVRSKLPTYTVPKDLPGLPHGRGPTCAGLPLLSPAQIPFPERGPVQ